MKKAANLSYILLIINYSIDHPLKSILNYSLTFFVLAMIALILLRTNMKLKIPLEFVIFSIFIFVSLVLGGIVAFDKSIFLNKFFSVLQGLIIFIISIILIQINKTEKINFWAISILPILLAINSYQNLGDNLFNLTYISEERLINGGLNPNIFSHILVMSLISIFYSIGVNKKNKYLILLLPVIIFLIAVSGSRNGLIGLAITLILLLLVLIIPLLQKKYGLLKGSIINIIITGIIIRLFFNTYTFISENLVVGDRLNYLNDFSTGSMYVRLLLYKESLLIFFENPITGIGFDQYRLISITGKYTHSDYMEILTSTGLIGFILYVLIYFVILFKIFVSLKNNRISYMTGAIFIVFLLSMLYFGFGRPWYDQNIRWFILGSISGTLIIKNQLKGIKNEKNFNSSL